MSDGLCPLGWWMVWKDSGLFVIGGVPDQGMVSFFFFSFLLFFPLFLSAVCSYHRHASPAPGAQTTGISIEIGTAAHRNVEHVLGSHRMGCNFLDFRSPYLSTSSCFSSVTARIYTCTCVLIRSAPLFYSAYNLHTTPSLCPNLTLCGLDYTLYHMYLFSFRSHSCTPPRLRKHMALLRGGHRTQCPSRSRFDRD